MTLFRTPTSKLILICAVYLLLAMAKGVTSLDGDEFAFISEPYEMLGGDYTISYIDEGEYLNALKTAAKSYYFFWIYRPMFAPIISDGHKDLFLEEEKRFGYVKPESVTRGDSNSLEKYKSRHIVPEPDRFYRQGAGKPLLSAVLSTPQLLFASIFYSGSEILELQFNERVHPFFILVRLIQILSGLLSIILIYIIASKEFDSEIAILSSAVFAFTPLTMNYFPDLHHDSILVPFCIASSYLLFTGRYIKGGLVYGLALASKNAAIFLLPAFAIYYVWCAIEINEKQELFHAIKYVIQKTKQLIIFIVLSLITLSPFANPVSYITEIITPITHREYDNRGEDVSKFMLKRDEDKIIGDSGILNSSIDAIRGLMHVRDIGGFRTGFLFFAILGVLLCVQLKPKPISMLSLAFLIMILPYGLVFKYYMANRYLIFVPYFSLLCAGVLAPRYMKILIWMLLCLSLMFSVELITGHPELWVSSK